MGAGDALEKYLPMIRRMAVRVTSMRPVTMEREDLVQEGVLGLMEAWDRFDHTQGVPFRAFAKYRIRGAMIDALRHSAWPRSLRKVHRRVEDGQSVSRQQTYRLSVANHLAGLTEHAMASLPDGLVPSAAPAPDERTYQREVAERVRRTLAMLPPRDRETLRLYYFAGCLLSEIARRYGVNASRACQLHRRALARFRAAYEGN